MVPRPHSQLLGLCLADADDGNAIRALLHGKVFYKLHRSAAVPLNICAFGDFLDVAECVLMVEIEVVVRRGGGPIVPSQRHSYEVTDLGDKIHCVVAGGKIVPIVGVAIVPKTRVVLVGVVANGVDPENAVVGRVIYDVADDPAPVPKALVHPSRRVVYDGDSVLYAAVFGILHIHYILDLVQIEFSFRGHVVDDLGTRRAVGVRTSVYPRARIVAVPPTRRHVFL